MKITNIIVKRLGKIITSYAGSDMFPATSLLRGRTYTWSDSNGVRTVESD